MALVVISIQDTADGVSVSAKAEPPMPSGAEASTDAARVGLACVNYAITLANQVNAERAPRLVVVGSLPKH